MKRPNFITRLPALLFVAVLAATAMPTAASGEPEQSGTLTVTVQVVDSGNDPGDGSDPCLGTVATLSFADQTSDLAATSFTQLPDELDMRGLLILTFLELGYDEGIPLEIEESFANTAVDAARGSTPFIEYLANPELRQIIYSPENSGIPKTHPADRNGDGKIEFPADLPPGLSQPSVLAGTPEFEVNYDAGICDEDPQFALLSVSRSQVFQESPTEQDFWFPLAENSDFMFADAFVRESAYAVLSRMSDSSDLSFGSIFARSFNPEVDNLASPDPVAFGGSGALGMFASVHLFDAGPGRFSVDFYFNLETGGAQAMLELGLVRISCYLNPDLDGCFGP